MTDLDRRLHELMGKCWHEFPEYDCWEETPCTKCGMVTWSQVTDAPSYLKWENYGELLQWCKRQESWSEFLYYLGDDTPDKVQESIELLLNPIEGCKVIDKFFGGMVNETKT